MVLTREEFRRRFRQQPLEPVYVLFGPETFLRDRAAKAITDHAFGPGDFRDFNENVFSLNTDGNLQSALSSAEQLPMMASRRVVRIADVRVSSTGIRDTLGEDDIPALSAYLADPSPHSIVIFVADDLNGVRKVGKYLRENAVAVDFARLNDAELLEWAEREARTAGVNIEPMVLRYLISRVGPDVLRLTNEIKKLAAAAMPSASITTKLIDDLVPYSRELTNFELTDHLVAGRGAKALGALRKILEDGAEPVALVGLLSYNYRRLLIAKDMMSRGADRAAVTSVVKLPYRGQEPFLAAARRADKGSLMRAVERLGATDLAIKTSKGGSGPAAARMQLEVLVCELAMM